jgi:hypothetical protein
MIAAARRTYPGLRFAEGSMTALDLADGELGGMIAWYSIIHTPPPRLGKSEKNPRPTSSPTRARASKADGRFA